jgi:hypothetical protein
MYCVAQDMEKAQEKAAHPKWMRRCDAWAVARAVGALA